jgi:ankyrin repeat protein
MMLIHENKHAEFAEVYKRYKAQKFNLGVDNPLEIGKTYLHLAVEHMAPKIISFLMFEQQADPNLLTHNTQMAALHIAVSRMQPAIIELLTMNKKTDVNRHSPLHGTPLHTACRTGSLKIVQQLLLNKANIMATCEVFQFVDGKRTSRDVTPKEVTKDKRIIRLIEKYEQRLMSGAHSPLKEEDFKLYGPLDSFANAPLQNETTRPG